MKKVILLSLIVLAIIGSSGGAVMRNVKPVAEDNREEGPTFERRQRPEMARKSPNPSYKPGELLVRFAPRANGKQRTRAEKKAFLASIGAGNVKRSYHIVPGLTHIKLPQGQSVENALKRLKGKGEILYAEPNYEVRALVEPNDPNFSDLWGMHNTGQTGGTADADIDAPEAWDLETDANEIVVAVIDTGVDYEHEDLAANMWTDANGSYGYDFVNDDNDPMDDHFHGTHCAGTIGAVGNNSTGVAGVCWEVQIMALKFLNSNGYGTDANAIAAIEYAIDNGADVLSNSWGGDEYSQSLKDAIEAADANGLLFVAAAGNGYGSNNDTVPLYPCSYDCDNIIAVLSTDHDDQMSGFSNYGPNSVDLGAPGGTNCYCDRDILSCKLGGGYRYAAGTSMATPHVAGACALVWAKHPTLSHLEVKEVLLKTVDEVEALDGLCLSNGRLNLFGAVLNKPVQNVTQQKWYDAIQDALDDANDLDLIKVRPGTYYENVDFSGVSCTLTSIDPNDPCVVAATIIDANGSGSVVTFENSEDANAVLTGFTITGGYKSSHYGGGIYCYNTSPTISNCMVENNYALYGGGMINRCVGAGGNPTVVECTFVGNEALGGGGIHTQEGEPTITGCTFTGNSAVNYAGGISVYWGSATINNCTFIRNSVTSAGGGIWVYDATSTVKDCLFYHNTANAGGGLYNDRSDLTLANCVFSSNSAYSKGGGIQNYSTGALGDTTLINCTFVNNSATNDNPTKNAYGGGMSNYNFGLLTVTNCIFWDNCADDGWDEIYNQHRAPNFSYCDIKGCGGSGSWNPNFGSDDGNNIDADPCFVDPNDPNGADDIWCTIDDGLAPGFGSPCIDAADNDAIDLAGDIAGNLRKRDDPCTTDTGNGTPPIVDMGSYEYVGDPLTIYVDPNATGGVYNGLSWSTALKDIEEAIGYSIDGDEIRVAQGTFTLSSTIIVDKEIKIYGGYDANSGQRDVDSYVTTVDGANSVRCFWVDANCTIDGVTIANGYASGGSGAGMYIDQADPNLVSCTFSKNIAYGGINARGGAIYNHYGDANLSNCTFSNNDANMGKWCAGGAMYNYCGSVTLSDCNFTANRVGEDRGMFGSSANVQGGGAMVNDSGTELTITNCTFSNNEAAEGDGGGLHNRYGSITVTYCTFSANYAHDDDGGGIYNYEGDANISDCNFFGNWADAGGGIGDYNSSSTITKCSFIDNAVEEYGGGIYNKYGAPTIANCTFTGNYTEEYDGGGIYNRYSDSNILDCAFFNNNTPDGHGAAIGNRYSSPNIDDCVFAKNTAAHDGGAISNYKDSAAKITSCVFWDNNSLDDGGAIENDESSPDIINCTFFENEADDDGGAIYNDDSDPNIYNCILWQNTAGGSGDEIYNAGSSNPDVEDCCIDEDPDFVDESDPDGDDDEWATCDDGLNLDSSSDCIDDGDEDAAEEDYDGLDVKGSDRDLDYDPDIGAYEYDDEC